MPRRGRRLCHAADHVHRAVVQRRRFTGDRVTSGAAAQRVWTRNATRLRFGRSLSLAWRRRLSRARHEKVSRMSSARHRLGIPSLSRRASHLTILSVLLSMLSDTVMNSVVSTRQAYLAEFGRYLEGRAMAERPEERKPLV